MKRCPQCGRDYDLSMSFCLDDGAELLYGPASMEEPTTAILHETGRPSEAATRTLIHSIETDSGHIIHDPADGQQRPASRTGNDRNLANRSKFKVILIVIIAVAGISVLTYIGYQQREYLDWVGSFFAGSERFVSSIAVLPFENRSGNSDTDYLSDGLADSLIYRLSQLPDLKVSPTSSVMRYKGTATDAAKVASELGVDSVMTGRLSQVGDNLNISVQLIDVKAGKVLWAEQYDRKMADLLATQREIATTIAQKLELKLAGTDAKGITKKYTDNNEAYQLYLKGRFYWNKRDAGNLEKAIEQFKAAANKDPNFALAYVGLADCYGVLPYYTDVRSSEAGPQARTYASRAIAIDDSLGEAHISLAWANRQLWDRAAAEKGFKRGLELHPNYATGHQWYGLYLQVLGRHDEALTHLKRAHDLEPLSLIIKGNLSEAYLAKGDADSSVEECKRAMELDPDWFYAHHQLAITFEKQGRLAEALKEAEKAVELSKRQNSVPLGFLGYVLAKAGRRNEALQVAEELKAKQAKGNEIAWVYLGLNEKDETFAWLERDFENRDGTMPVRLALYPLYSLRDDPRYNDLRKRMGLPE